MDVPAIAIGIGPWALACLIVLTLIRGDLVPRKTHERQMLDRDQVIRDITIDRDYYREQTLQLLRVADVAADRVQQALLSRSIPERERGQS